MGNIWIAGRLLQFSLKQMRTGRHEFVRSLGLLAGLAFGLTTLAEEVQHLSITQPGGMPGLPVLTGIQKTTNGVKLSWDGPSGYYQLYYQTILTGGNWQTLGGPNLNRTTNLTTLLSNAFFRVAGPSPQYAGAQSCLECHPNVHASEVTTGHANAFQSLVNIRQDKNPSCLPCHTVGYGLPTGYNTNTSPAHLRGVQCESCHGPAARHAANEMDLTVRPRVEIAAQVCGGCHTGSHQPTYEEWNSSLHAIVTEDMNLTSRINSCGRCHSGTARLAMVKGMSATTIANTLTNDANVAITCAVCHDPHSENVWTNVLSGAVSTNQLRYPVASTNYFSLSTSTPFTNRFDINVCAQCHNDRGAVAISSSSRAPHHSPQYNVLMGSVGILANGSDSALNSRPGTHALALEKQCVTCHMPTREYESEAHPAFTGHTFKVATFDTCRSCHPFPEELADFTAFVVTNRIGQLKAALDLWGATKAPDILRTNYGALSWEYNPPGELSVGTSSPSSSQQSLIPVNIRNARFNLYIIQHDGSHGAHNPLFMLELLDAASAWVQQELNQ